MIASNTNNLKWLARLRTSPTAGKNVRFTGVVC
jgi:hypothetical protein